MTTFTKLKSGDWGVRVQGTATVGQTVTVTKKSGETQTVTIAKVVWSGNGVSLCAISQGQSKGRNGYVPAIRDSRGYVTERGHYAGYCGYPCPVTGRKCCPENGPCHDCE